MKLDFLGRIKNRIRIKKLFDFIKPKRLAAPDPQKRFYLVIALACIFSGASTCIVLSRAAAYGKKLASFKDRTPDYVRYVSMGYAFDTVSSKKNILISVTDEGGLCRSHVFTIDEDRHTLDVLELPPDTLVSCEGFDGTLAEAFETPVYKSIVGRALYMGLDGEISLDCDALSDCTALLGGITIVIEKPVILNETQFAKGKRTVAGSVAGIIASDGGCYCGSDPERILTYRRLLASLIKKISEKGAVVWVNDLLSVIVNQISTDMTVNEIIDIANNANKISYSAVNIRLLPGQPYSVDGKTVYAADVDKTSEILNDYFRVKNYDAPAEKLALTRFDGVSDSYSDFKTKITDILK